MSRTLSVPNLLSLFVDKKLQIETSSFIKKPKLLIKTDCANFTHFRLVTTKNQKTKPGKNLPKIKINASNLSLCSQAFYIR